MANTNKSDKLKWIFTCIAFVVVFVLLAGLCMQLFAKDKYKPSEWFKQEETAEVGDEDNNSLVVGEIANNDIMLLRTEIPVEEYSDYGISPAVESAFRITATVNDETGDTPDYLQSVAYSMSWASENSQNVTDFVKMDVDDMTATFSCLKAFNTQIVVKIASTYNTSKFATVTLDYYKRVTDVNVEFLGTSHTIGVSETNKVINVHFPANYDNTFSTSDPWGNFGASVNSLKWSNGLQYSDGSVENPLYGSAQNNSITITTSKEFRSAYAKYYGSNTMAETLNSYSGIAPQDSYSYGCLNILYVGLVASNNSADVLSGRGHYNYITRALYETSNQFTVTLKFKLQHGEVVTFTYILNVTVDAPAVGSVTSSDSSHIF